MAAVTALGPGEEQRECDGGDVLLCELVHSTQALAWTEWCTNEALRGVGFCLAVDKACTTLAALSLDDGLDGASVVAGSFSGTCCDADGEFRRELARGSDTPDLDFATRLNCTQKDDVILLVGPID